MPNKVIFNPYSGIDWGTIQRHKANMHCHTTHSDGAIHPHEAVDRYHDAGYTILAMTDHDGNFPHIYSDRNEILTYPWTDLNNKFPDWDNRNPDTLGMVSINGVEVSSVPHLLSHFNNFPGYGTQDALWALQQIKTNAGFATFAHPGRYWVDPSVYLGQTKQWYLDWYRDYRFLKTLYGVEVLNANIKHPEDEGFWDFLLTNTMPTRPIFSFGNDDEHSYGFNFGGSWSVFLLDALSESSVKNAYAKGSVLACGRTHTNAPTQPEINEIIVTDTHITIHAAGYDIIEWVSEGNVVGSSETIDTSHLNKYVRAKLSISNGNGETHVLTQPFGLSEGGIKFDDLEFDNKAIRATSNNATTMECTQVIAGQHFGTNREIKEVYNSQQIDVSLHPDTVSVALKAIGEGVIETGEILYKNPVEVEEHQRKQRAFGVVLLV